MDNEKIGQFISQLRKDNQMTQKDLAAKLNITDKAVSKWERGLNYPDISLLPTIAEVLGVTTSELLNGERNDFGSKDIDTNIDNALYYAEKTTKNKVKSLQNISTIIFSALLLTGMIVCIICDVAISGGFTWSLYLISSIIFTWLVFFPVLKFGKKGIVGTIISISLFTIPFLYALNFIIKTNKLLLPIGIRISVICIVFLWIMFLLFRVLAVRRFFAGGISVLALIPLDILINITISKFILEPWMDVWDIVGFIIIVILAAAFFIADCRVHKNQD